MSYTGADAGAVLDKILKDSEADYERHEVEVHELDNDTEIRHPFGFQPNPVEAEPEVEPDEPEVDDEPDDPER